MAVDRSGQLMFVLHDEAEPRAALHVWALRRPVRTHTRLPGGERLAAQRQLLGEPVVLSHPDGSR